MKSLQNPIAYSLIICILVGLTGCAAQTLRINPEEFNALQTTKDGMPTCGCVATRINASSGIAGGDTRIIVTWGELGKNAVDWCIGR